MLILCNMGDEVLRISRKVAFDIQCVRRLFGVLVFDQFRQLPKRLFDDTSRHNLARLVKSETANVVHSTACTSSM